MKTLSKAGKEAARKIASSKTAKWSDVFSAHAHVMRMNRHVSRYTTKKGKLTGHKTTLELKFDGVGDTLRAQVWLENCPEFVRVLKDGVECTREGYDLVFTEPIAHLFQFKMVTDLENKPTVNSKGEKLYIPNVEIIGEGDTDTIINTADLFAEVELSDEYSDEFVRVYDTRKEESDNLAPDVEMIVQKALNK